MLVYIKKSGKTRFSPAIEVAYPRLGNVHEVFKRVRYDKCYWEIDPVALKAHEQCFYSLYPKYALQFVGFNDGYTSDSLEPYNTANVKVARWKNGPTYYFIATPRTDVSGRKAKAFYNKAQTDANEKLTFALWCVISDMYSADRDLLFHVKRSSPLDMFTNNKGVSPEVVKENLLEYREYLRNKFEKELNSDGGYSYDRGYIREEGWDSYENYYNQQVKDSIRRCGISDIHAFLHRKYKVPH